MNKPHPYSFTARRCVHAIALIAAAMAADFGMQSMAHATPPPSWRWHHWHARHYWWRQPVIHTVQEEFFLLHMRTRYGADWLRWMSDPVIEAHWNRFLLWRFAGR